MGECKWCHGTGTQYVERGSSLCYNCTDCGGSGYLPECDVCGEEYYGEFCEHCYCECISCGCESRRYEDSDICEDCYNIGKDNITNAVLALEHSEEWERVEGYPPLEVLKYGAREYAFKFPVLNNYMYMFIDDAKDLEEAVAKYTKAVSLGGYASVNLNEASNNVESSIVSK